MGSPLSSGHGLSRRVGAAQAILAGKADLLHPGALHAHMRDAAIELYLGDKIEHFEDRPDHVVVLLASGKRNCRGCSKPQFALRWARAAFLLSFGLAMSPSPPRPCAPSRRRCPGDLDAHGARGPAGADVTGLWFIKVNVVRDDYAINDRETSAWDRWREAPLELRNVASNEFARLDDLAVHPERPLADIAPAWLSE